MKALLSIIQWVLLTAMCVGVWWVCKHPPIVVLSCWKVIGIALSTAFTWVELLKWGTTKPFNCVKCMTGWFSLAGGLLVFGWYGIVLLPVGLFVGAIFEAIKLRWL